MLVKTLETDMTTLDTGPTHPYTHEPLPSRLLRPTHHPPATTPKPRIRRVRMRRVGVHLVICNWRRQTVASARAARAMRGKTAKKPTVASLIPYCYKRK